MDLLERAYFEKSFKCSFMEKRGDAFQDFFADIMSRGYPGDFMRCRPWGRKGDRKNDGYLPSSRTLFQVYAPNEMRENDCVRKINEDFNGALPYWKDYFSTWVFVHNSLAGLGPTVTEKLLHLGHKHPGIIVSNWGFETLRNEVFRLSEVDVVSLLGLGHAPSYYDMLAVRFEHLQTILVAIEMLPPSLDSDLRRMPPGKLTANQLSESIVVLIEEGLKKSNLVGGFLNKHPNPLLGEGIAATFRQRYLNLKEDGKSPDEIFHALHVLAGGTQQSSDAGEAAVLAVLAYFFEKCDIFERPIEGVLK